MRINCFIVFMFGVALFLYGCTTTQKGIGSDSYTMSSEAGGGSTSGKIKKGGSKIEVLVLTHKEAMDIAYEIAEDIFSDSDIRYKSDYSSVRVTHRDFWRGDVRMTIKANIILNRDIKDESGIIYDIKSDGFGSNPSIGPGYVANMFFEGLKNYRDDNQIETLHFSKYKSVKDKGIVSFISASIPTTYSGFKKYIDDKLNKKRFEGIWTTAEGKYTMGIVYTRSDPQYKYKGFVINSKTPKWKPGQIKAKFVNLRNKKLSPGVLHLQSKAEVGVTWNVTKELISVAASSTNIPFALIKQYPESGYALADEFVSGVGSAWAISESGVFVTNAHVVEGAEKIHIGFRSENPPEARVLIIDKRLDIAIIKLLKPKRKYTPIPLSSNIANNGTDIIVIGYPLAFDLGDDPRVNEGVISSQSGISKDVTRYQISANLNPGNSGGPVLDLSGNVVGIAVEKLTEGEGVNFAIKSGYIKSLLEQVSVIPAKNNSTKNMSAAEVFKKHKQSILPIWTE